MTRDFLATDLKVLEKYYDIARVIDPSAIVPVVLPTAIDSSKENEQRNHFGTHGQTCDQCICLKAIHYKETFVKTEVRQGSLFLITAMPLEMDGRTVALELVKCISGKILKNFFSMPKENTNIYHFIAELNDLAFRDALTNMYNRRYIDEQLPVEISQARQHNLLFFIVMTDIDFFKQVNDQYGHAVGGEVLIVFPTAAGSLHITASFGVHTFSGRESDLFQLMDKVDKNLHQAKQDGRNSIVSTN